MTNESNLSNVKDPDDIDPETRQEMADIKQEELKEVDPNAYDVINGGSRDSSDTVDEIHGDIKALTLNEKYALILHQARQIGPLFFAQVSPDTFELPERDPLNLVWINILTGWQLASTILSQFEQNIVVTEQFEKEDKEAISNAEVDTDVSAT